MTVLVRIVISIPILVKLFVKLNGFHKKKMVKFEVQRMSQINSKPQKSVKLGFVQKHEVFMENVCIDFKTHE